MNLTNFERWKAMMSWCPSPESYIDWGFYYLIAAALQRRVYTGPAHLPLFPNIYCIPTGPPGVGKGLVIKQISDILKYHKMPDPRENAAKYEQGLKADHEKISARALAKDDFEIAQKEEQKFSKTLEEKPLLIPVASDATTYESLVDEMAASLRRRNYTKFDEKLKRDVLGIYTHSSLCYCLEEISSLFRKHTNDVVNFLIRAYDCGDYKYSTKTQGKSFIKNPCLNFYGGTQPDFLQEVFSDRLLTQGFASRCFFIYATKNRKRTQEYPDLTEEQKQHQAVLIAHVEKLAYLFGHIDFTPEAKAFIEKWWVESEHKRPNMNPKLDPYYARKDMHLKKLSIIHYCGEHADLGPIDVPYVQCALNTLDREEKMMHFALSFDATNPLFRVATKIEKYLKSLDRPATFKELLAEFWQYLSKDSSTQDLQNTLEHLEQTNKIIRIQRDHPVTKLPTMFYSPYKNGESE